MRITAITDTSDLRGRLREYASITGREIGESVRQYARVACVNLATATQPFGDGVDGKAKGETAVARDIYKVYYPSTGSKFLNQATNIARGYYLAKGNKKAKETANKFKDRLLRYQMSGNSEAISRIAADMKFEDVMLDAFDSTPHKSSRDHRGRVKNAKPILVIGAEDQLEKYVNNTQRKVGLTKAGWAVCAEKIPLKRVSSATRGIPQWVTRNKGRASGRITDGSSDPVNPKVTMTNATPWTSQVLSPSQANNALQQARYRFVKYMNTAVKETLRKQAKLKSA